jgi:hypothetical protein
MSMIARSQMRLLPVLSLVTMLALGACVLGPSAEPGLERAIRAHYASYATEENGHCRAPKIDTIQSHEPRRKADDGADVLMVRYSYFDQHADMDANYSRLFHLSQECGGIAEREFTLVRYERSYRVTEMAGEQHGGENTR